MMRNYIGFLQQIERNEAKRRCKEKLRVTSIVKGILRLLGLKSLDDGKRQITLNSCLIMRTKVTKIKPLKNPDVKMTGFWVIVTNGLIKKKFSNPKKRYREIVYQKVKLLRA